MPRVTRRDRANPPATTGRTDGKNTHNNRKANMTQTKSRDSTPAKPEKNNTEEEKRMDLKIYFMKMIEILKKK